MSTAVHPPLHVMAAAIFDASGQRLLIQRRHARQHQGSLWEFPGGKLEAGESRQAGLARELEEELGIRPTQLRPLICIRHDYPERSVLLDVWRVDAFEGEPYGREGQPIAWVDKAQLDDYDYPAANLPIVSAAKLPERLLVTPSPESDREAFLAALERSLAAGVELVQLRAPELSEADYIALAREVLPMVDGAGARLLLNADVGLLQQVPAHGVHLSSQRLASCSSRPLPSELLLSCACHSAADLARAAALNADFALLGAVQVTATHPEREALGWTRFAELVSAAKLPVYALGGMSSRDIPTAWGQGAQGIAAIRALWDLGRD